MAKMDDLQEIKEKLTQFEERLKVLEDYCLPKVQEAKTKIEQEVYREYIWLLKYALDAENTLRHYSQCKLIRKADGLYYREIRGKEEIHINIPYGVQRLTSEAHSVGFKKLEDLFHKELTKKKLELWHELFNRDEIEKQLEELRTAGLGRMPQVYDKRAFERRIEAFKKD